MKYIKQNYWLVILFIVGLAMRLYAAYMDPFLHDWDERFHALVARNLMDNFWEPVLIKNTLVAFNPIDWSAYHIWLHKQPLFLWQMALSMKIFGVSEFTLRLPSALMGSIMILLLYRITYILTKNKRTSLLSALLLCFSNYQMQLISGIEGMDHNDIAFEFYMLASCWAYAEYFETKKWYWAIVIGIFSGCAILNKWLIGLAIFLGWGINFLIQFYKSKSLKELKWILISLLVCCLIFAPWQLYIFYRWPKEALFEMQFNSRHITEVLEGHWGPPSYYFDAFDLYFGKFLWWIIPIGVFYFIQKKQFNQNLMITFSSIIVFVFCFLSYIVKTKVHSHFFFVIPFILIFIANAISELIQVRNNKIITSIIIVSIAYLSIQPAYFIDYLNKGNYIREKFIHNAILYRNIKNYIPNDVKYVTNVNALEHINVMFYHPEIKACQWWLSSKDLNLLKLKKEKIAVFESHDAYLINDTTLQYPYLIVIHQKLR